MNKSPDAATTPVSDCVSSTVELVALARGGDRLALDNLFARHRTRLRRWARGRLPPWVRDLADTDDIVQEALCQTFRRIDAFEARASGALHAYLRQAVLNRIRDEVRRRRRQPVCTELDLRTPDDAPSPVDQVIGREALERYKRALAQLRSEEQGALIGRLEMGCSYEELAASLGRPSPDAVRKLAQRALVRLVQLMDDPD